MNVLDCGAPLTLVGALLIRRSKPDVTVALQRRRLRRSLSYGVPMRSMISADDLATLHALEREVLWLDSWTIHHANHACANADGPKVGGHRASSASLVSIMTALYFSILKSEDRVAVKPHGCCRSARLAAIT
jgi:pyruvate dehydrogenase complex dehydrogenase (E1) component